MAESAGILRTWFSGLLDWVFPTSCQGCGEDTKDGIFLCEDCLAAVPSIHDPFCAQCSEVFPGRIEGPFECPNCRDQTFAFDFARSGVVRSNLAMELIHEFKYLRRIQHGRTLALLARRAFDDPRLARALKEKWPLIPVPLHRRRMGWRQFNQAEEIARPLGKMLGLPVISALKRIRPTPTQTRLSRSQRQKNLKGAFVVARSAKDWPGVILIDDVFTTGSTVHECARTLRAAGIQNVVVVTVMRG
ncbi:MAG: ComF family protein [Akkermansiaceae bacterium]|jgi:ComF family protein|nr:ComF family protein [Akkermansiaceae bacterium]